ncbi:hypothetical protein DL93DRAFT_2101530 [Clavulina sp. PMI_390]|nr:hypothetical protein DL93DRAFT_2101530 [Clavulina sp. PMI_390]
MVCFAFATLGSASLLGGSFSAYSWPFLLQMPSLKKKESGLILLQLGWKRRSAPEYWNADGMDTWDGEKCPQSAPVGTPPYLTYMHSTLALEQIFDGDLQKKRHTTTFHVLQIQDGHALRFEKHTLGLGLTSGDGEKRRSQDKKNRYHNLRNNPE